MVGEGVGEGLGGWIERMICLATKAAALAIFTLANSILFKPK